MAPQFVLPQFVPIEAVKLGRFSTTIRPPFPDYHDPDFQDPSDVLVSHLQSYHGAHHGSTDSSFGASLTSVLSAVFSKRAKTNVHIETNTYKVYYLERYDGWFEKAAATPDWRQWAERKYHFGDDIYMVIGFHTVTDARIAEDSAAGEAKGGQLKLPVSPSLAAAGVIVPLGDVVDPSVGGATQATGVSQSKFVARGEQLCAVEYRQVSPRWLSSKKLDTSRLTKAPRWVCMERSRDDVEGQDDLIEVELTDVQAGEEEWTEEVVGDDTFLVLQPEDPEL